MCHICHIVILCRTWFSHGHVQPQNKMIVFFCRHAAVNKWIITILKILYPWIMWMWNMDIIWILYGYGIWYYIQYPTYIWNIHEYTHLYSTDKRVFFLATYDPWDSHPRSTPKSATTLACFEGETAVSLLWVCDTPQFKKQRPWNLWPLLASCVMKLCCQHLRAPKARDYYYLPVI
jgi:hypothetical protein